MTYGRQKDPMRQYLGKVSKAKGQAFEKTLDTTFEYYKEKGFAHIEKTPEPMRPVRNLGNGKFEAFYEKKAQADYKGTLKGGRTIIFEAKFTDAEKMEKSRVSKEQTDYIEDHYRLGARCYVLAGFGTGETYCIPWDVWQNMKELFGRKYVTEKDIQKYKLKVGWNGVLLILE